MSHVPPQPPQPPPYPPQGYAPPPAYAPVRHVLSDIDISFGRWIVIFIKMGLAAVPAMIVLMIIWSIIAAILGAIFGGVWVGMMGENFFDPDSWNMR
jgi:hypothetical protein